MLMRSEPIDRHVCRQLALRVTGGFTDVSWASFVQDELRDIIETHDSEPAKSIERLQVLEPTILSLLQKNDPRAL